MLQDISEQRDHCVPRAKKEKNPWATAHRFRKDKVARMLLEGFLGFEIFVRVRILI